MIETRAVVIEAGNGEARVLVQDRQGGCGRCDEPGGCRSVKLAYALKAPVEIFSVPDRIGVSPGDQVVLRIPDRAPLLGAMLSYGLAVVLMLGGAAIGHFSATAGQEDLAAAFGAGFGIVLAVILNRSLARSRRWREGLRIEMARGEPEFDPCRGARG